MSILTIERLKSVSLLSDLHLPDGLKRHRAIGIVADGAPGQPRRVGAEDGQVEVEVGERLEHALRPPPLAGRVEQQDLEGRLMALTLM